MEIVVVQLSVLRQLNIISVYRSPLCEKAHFKTNMLSVMKWCCDIPMCIDRDFNEDILLNSTGPIFDMFTEQWDTQHVRMPVRDSQTLIDQI